MIPYGRQHIDDEDIQSVVEVLQSGWLTTGPKVGEFERAFADFVGAKPDEPFICCQNRSGWYKRGS